MAVEGIRRRPWGLAAVAAALALGVAGCGRDDDDAKVSTTQRTTTYEERDTTITTAPTTTASTGGQVAYRSDDDVEDRREELLEQRQEEAEEVAEAAREADEDWVEEHREDLAEWREERREAVEDRTEDATEEARERNEELAEDAQERDEEAQERDEELAEDAQERNEELAEDAQERNEELAERNEDAAEDARERHEELAERNEEAAEDAREEREDVVEDARERDEEVAEDARERQQEVAEERREEAEEVAEAAEEADEEWVQQHREDLAEWQEERAEAQGERRGDTTDGDRATTDDDASDDARERQEELAEQREEEREDVAEAAREADDEAREHQEDAEEHRHDLAEEQRERDEELAEDLREQQEQVAEGQRDAQEQVAQDQRRRADEDRTVPAGMPNAPTDGAQQGTTKLWFPSEQGAVLLVERRIPQQARAGEELAYQVVVTNRSQATLHDVVVEDELMVASNQPQQAPDAGSGQRQGQQPQARPDQANRGQAPGPDATADERRRWIEESRMTAATGVEPMRWELPMLGPGQSRTFQGKLMVPGEGGVTICTSATYQMAYCSQVQVVKPAIGLSAMIVNGQNQPLFRLLACDEAFLLYRVTNAGTAPTAAVRVTHPLPAGVRWAEVASVQTATNPQARPQQGQAQRGQQAQPGQAGQLAFELPAIPAGQTVERKFRLMFDGPVGIGGSIATAQAGDIQARAPLHGIQVLKPELTVQVDGPERAYIGRPVTYRVTVANPSPAPAFDTKVTLQLPQNAQRLDIDSREVRGQNGVYELGTLQPGQARTFALTFDATEAGAFAGTINAEAYCATAVREELRTELVGIPAIRLETIDLTDPVQIGGECVYEVQVKNQGSAEDMDIKLQGQLPAQLRFIAGSGDTAVTGNGQTIEFAPIARLAPGDVATWRIRAQCLQEGQVRFVLNMTSNANRQAVVEQEPTTLVREAENDVGK